MFSQRWRLFRLLGIPISLDASWLIILALVTWGLTLQFERVVPGLQSLDYWIMGLGTALAYFICIVLHELGHALVARARGLPISGITLFLFGGVSELKGEPTSPGTEFLLAIGGPVVSALLAVVFWGLWRLGPMMRWGPAALAILYSLALINALVLAFNLVPAFPMDGGRVFRSILWAVTGSLRRATYWASLLGQAFAWLLILGGIFLTFFVGMWDGLWLALVGWFLNSAAQSSYQQVLLRETLRGEPVRRFMNPQPIVVPPNLDLRHWVEDYVYRYHRKVFPVTFNGRLEGYIGTSVLSRYPREEWEQHTVAEVMHHDLKPITISPNADALQALGKMQRTGLSRLLVIEDGQLVGIVTLKDLLRFFQLKLELEQEEEPKPPDGA